MLTLTSDSSSPSFCDGLTRRSFLRLGALGLGAMNLAAAGSAVSATGTAASAAGSSSASLHSRQAIAGLAENTVSPDASRTSWTK